MRLWQLVLDVMRTAMTDPFERLGLPRRFSVDAAALEREYLARSRLVHPDFHQDGSAADQQTSLESAAALNEAYQTLKEPARRAECLLGLYGGPTAAEDKSQDQEFLMEMMELREQIDTERSSGCEPGDFGSIGVRLEEQENYYETGIVGEFGRIERLPADDLGRAVHLRNVRQSLNALKTIRSLLRDIA